MDEGHALLIVRIGGHFCGEHIEEIQSIAKRIKENPKTKFVVLDMSETIDIESKVIFSFAKIQKEIRDYGLQIRVCSLHSKLKRRLIERGIVRENEIHDSLTLAVKSLITKQKDEKKLAA